MACARPRGPLCVPRRWCSPAAAPPAAGSKVLRRASLQQVVVVMSSNDKLELFFMMVTAIEYMRFRDWWPKWAAAREDKAAQRAANTTEEVEAELQETTAAAPEDME